MLNLFNHWKTKLTHYHWQLLTKILNHCSICVKAGNYTVIYQWCKLIYSKNSYFKALVLFNYCPLNIIVALKQTMRLWIGHGKNSRLPKASWNGFQTMSVKNIKTRSHYRRKSVHNYKYRLHELCLQHLMILEYHFNLL
jgi:hypothetical protein